MIRSPPARILLQFAVFATIDSNGVDPTASAAPACTPLLGTHWCLWCRRS